MVMVPTAVAQAGSADGVDGGNDARSPSFASRGVGGGPPKTFASAGVGADLDAEGQQEADAVAAALAVAKVGNPLPWSLRWYFVFCRTV